MSKEVLTVINGLELRLTGCQTYRSSGNQEVTFNVSPAIEKQGKKQISLRLAFNPKTALTFEDCSCHGDGRLLRKMKRVAEEMGSGLFISLLRDLVELASVTMYTVTFDETGNKRVEQTQKVVFDTTVFEFNEFLDRSEAERYNGEVPFVQCSTGMMDFTDPEFNPENAVFIGATISNTIKGDPLSSLDKLRSLVYSNVDKLRGHLCETLYKQVQVIRNEKIERSKRMLEGKVND